MTAGQLSWIKQRQREHQQLFGAPLLIDFNKMKDIRNYRIFDLEKVEEWINNYIFVHNIDMNVVKNEKLSNNHPKEYRFIKDFAQFLKDNNLNYSKSAKLIGKERTTLRYHIKNL